MSEQANETEAPVIETTMADQPQDGGVMAEQSEHQEDTMAKIGEVVEKPLEEQDNPEGVHLGPASDGAGDYPERPYSEAISDAHRATLAESGIIV